MALVDEFGRELIEVHQLDYPACSNTYGEGPCTAVAGIRPSGYQIAVFDGTASISLDPTLADNTKPWSIEFKLNRDNVPITTFTEFVYSEEESGNNPYNGLNIGARDDWTSGSGTLNFITSQAVSGWPKITGLSANTDYAVKFVYDGTLDVQVFLDDVSQGVFSSANPQPNSNIDAATISGNVNSVTRYFKGKIWDLKITVDNVLVRDIPLNGTAEDLTSNTTPTATNVTYDLVCPPILRQVAEFDGTAQIQLEPFNMIDAEFWVMGFSFFYDGNDGVLYSEFDGSGTKNGIKIQSNFLTLQVFFGASISLSAYSNEFLDIIITHTNTVSSLRTYDISINGNVSTVNITVPSSLNTNEAKIGAGPFFGVGSYVGKIYDFYIKDQTLDFIINLPLEGTAEDLTGNTTPVATNITWTEVELDGREAVERQVAEFDGTSSSVSFVSIDTSSNSWIIELDWKILDSAQGDSILFIQTPQNGSIGNNRLYVNINNGFLKIGQTNTSEQMPFVSIVDGGSYNLRLEKNGLDLRYILTGDSTGDQTITFTNDFQFLPTDIITLGRYPIFTAFFDGEMRDFKAWENSVLVRDLPMDGSAEDLTGNTTPVATNVTWPTIVESYICALQPDPDKKCYNTFATCQDTPNYSPTTKTLTFTKSQTAIVKNAGETLYTLPLLSSYTTKPTEVNVGARRTSSFNLGEFGRADIRMTDMQHTDNFVDEYVKERTFNPLERGTFWSKFLARVPYFENSEYRIYEGWKGQQLSEMDYRKYLVDRISNPDSNGNVNINCVDVFRRLDAVKAQYPTQSQSRLLGDISSTETTIKTSGLANSAGDLQTNFISISNEIISYASVTDNLDGTFTYNNCIRQQFDTEPTEHSDGDAVQHTVHFSKLSTNSSLYNVVYLLFKAAGFHDTDLDLTGWDEEINTWLVTFQRMERVLFKPVAIDKLLGELCQQCGFFMWFDDVEKLVKIKAIRPETPEVTLTESNNLIAGKTKPTLETNERVSVVVVDHDIISGSKNTGSRDSYKKTSVRLGDGGSQLKYGSNVTFSLQAPWLYTNSQVTQLTSRVLRRYSDNTKFLEIEVDARDDLRIGQVFKLAYSKFVLPSGLPEELTWQVISRHKLKDTIKIKCQQFYLLGNFFVYAPDTLPDYTAATEEEKARYGWYAPLPDGKEYIYS